MYGPLIERSAVLDLLDDMDMELFDDVCDGSINGAQARTQREILQRVRRQIMTLRVHLDVSRPLYPLGDDTGRK